MRRAFPSAVSSALLLLLTACAPCHVLVEQNDVRSSVLTVDPKLMISEFYPRGLCGDEYVAIANPSGLPANLRNWSFSDGEGTVAYVGDVWVAPGLSHFVSWNMSSFSSAYGRLPDSCIFGDSRDVNVSVLGSFKLSDEGDSITLRSPSGTVSDYVAYGTVTVDASCWNGAPVPLTRQGEIGKRVTTAGYLVDTDSSSDWAPFREYRYGYTEFEPATYELPEASVVAFASPDCALDVVLEAFHSARSLVRLCAYELSSGPVCEALLGLIELGVDVNVLVDGAPAGGMEDDEARCLSALATRGAKVRILNGNHTEDRVQHVGPLHAKYVVIDHSSVLVLSENFVESGLPTDRLFGNRGWGLWIKGSEPAGYVGRVFEEDFRASRPDVLDWRNDRRYSPWATVPAQGASAHENGVLTSFQSLSRVRVSFFVSPDCSRRTTFLEPMIESAGEVVAEQFQTDLNWISRWKDEVSVNPVLSSMVKVLAAGGSVRMLLDSSWFNLKRNAEVMDFMNAAFSMWPRQGTASLISEDSPIEILHNKGFVFDERVSIVSSNNLVMSSFCRNRELAVAVDSPEIAAYFLRAFELDWSPDRVPPTAVAGNDAEIMLGETITLGSMNSTDDRAIAWIHWDVARDGIVECSSDTYEFHPSAPGVFQIELIVEDAWGNRGSDVISVRVRTAEDGIISDLVGKNNGWRAVIATSGALLAAYGLVLVRRRRNRSRKVNQPPSD